jgi:hypothetical protein
LVNGDSYVKSEDDVIVYLHYFIGNSDWYITECDQEHSLTTSFTASIIASFFLLKKGAPFPIGIAAPYGFVQLTERLY